MNDPVMTPPSTTGGAGSDRASAVAPPTARSLARVAGALAIVGALLMVAGAAVWQSTGVDLDRSLAAGEMAIYLADAGAVSGALVANLTLWILGVLVLGAAGTAMERLPASSPLAARFGLLAFWTAVPLAITAFVSWLALVVHAAGAGSAQAVAVAEVVGWFASRADWVATVLIVSVAPVCMTAAGRGTWAPKWLAGLAALAGVGGVATVVAMFTDALSSYGFLSVPLGLLWMFGAGVALLRGAS